MRAPRRGRRQGFEHKEGLVDRAETVRADDERRRAQFRNQVARIEAFAKRTQQAARAFDENNVVTSLRTPDMCEHFSQSNALTFAPGRKQRRERRAEMPRVDFIQRQRVAKRGVQRACVATPAGAERLDRSYGEAARKQMPREQTREHRLAHAGVCAGDEENLSCHARESKHKPPALRDSKPRRLVKLPCRAYCRVVDTSRADQPNLDSHGKRRLLWPLLVIGALLAVSTLVLFMNALEELEPRPIGECFAGNIEGLGVVRLQLKITTTNAEGTCRLHDGVEEATLDGQRAGGSAFRLVSVVENRLDERTNGVFQFAIAGVPPALRGSWIPTGTTQNVVVELCHIAKLMKLQRRVGLSIAGFGGTKDFFAEFPVFSDSSPFHADVNRQVLGEMRRREAEFNTGVVDHMLEGTRVRSPSYAWDAFSRIEIVHSSEAIASMRDVEYQYTGGAHGNSSHGGMNFIAANEKVTLFKLEDLFKPDSDWLRRLEKFCVTDLMRQEASSIGGEDHQFNAEELANFTVSPAGLQIYFSPYAVGSYAEGAFTVHVPWEILRPCLRPDGPAQYLTDVKPTAN